MLNVHAYFFDKIAQMFLFCRQVSDVHWKESKTSRGQSKVVNKIKILFLFFLKSNSNISHIDYKIIIIDMLSIKGAGSFHIHRKTMRELGTLALLGIRERPNLAQNLVTHWN